MKNENVSKRLGRLVRQERKAQAQKAEGRFEDRGDIFSRYERLLTEVLQDIASVSKVIDYYAGIRCKKYAGQRFKELIEANMGFFESSVTYEIKLREGSAEIIKTDNCLGDTLWSAQDIEGSTEEKWKAAVEYIQTEFLEDVSKPIVEAELEFAELIAKYGTEEDGIREGQRWASFSEDWERKTFLDGVAGFDTDDDDFSITDLEEPYSDCFVSAEWFCLNVVPEYDGSVLGVDLRWIHLIPDDFWRGFIDGAVERLLYFHQMQSENPW